MRTSTFLLSFACSSICLLISPPIAAVTWYVDGSVASPGDGTSWETAFKTIQEGMDVAADGDTVTVAEGIYVENIHFNGRNIALRSANPLDRAGVANTIIDGGQADSVVTFAGTEKGTCTLAGFTIRNGRAEERNGAGICGGTEQDHTEAAIHDNVVVSNCVVGTSPLGHGGGIAYCDGTIKGCIFADNTATMGDGGGLFRCHGRIENNSIFGNSTTFGGGGLFDCDGIILGNRIFTNSANHGGGLSQCDGTVEGNTIYGNSGIGGLAYSHGTIKNCIVWGNRAWPQLYGCSVPTYSCVERRSGGAEGNIDHFPYFVDPEAGDFHLKSWSPCIDAGDPASAFNREPQPDGGKANIGAYGNTPEAAVRSPDQDNDGLPDDWEMEHFGELSQKANGDADGDLIPHLEEYHLGLSPMEPVRTWYVDGTASVSGDGTSWESAFNTIQEGVDAASERDTVVVAQGTYAENLRFRGPNIVLRSRDPLDSEVVAGTIIRSNISGNTVDFSGVEDDNCVLSGFTIQGGAGICGAEGHARIENNTISGSSSAGLSQCHGSIQHNRILGNLGGGLFQCHGTISNNTIANNSAEQTGAGLADCDGTIQSNVITENSAGRRGGGLFDCDGVIQGNTIVGNSATVSGGALCLCAATIQDNTISENRAEQENGGGTHECTGIIQDNVISDNNAEKEGGGMYGCQGLIERNTIIKNSAGESGGGMSTCHGTVQINTVSGNSAGISGGGLAHCIGAIQSNLISDNSTEWGNGGGVFDCGGVIQNNLVVSNSAGDSGGGLAGCQATIENNTIAGNIADEHGGGLSACRGAIRNCVVWGNDSRLSGDQTYDSQTLRFSCVQDWNGTISGNINKNPLFVDPEQGDYHLQADSPCMDAGESGYWLSWPQWDMDGNCRLFGQRVDMGCYEHGSKSDSDGDLLNDSDESAIGSDPDLADTDGDGLRDGLEVMRGCDPVTPTGPGTVHVPEDVPTIQLSLFAAQSGDEIVVALGTYRENLQFFGTDVVLRSTSPAHPKVVAKTVMDGGRAGPVVRFSGDESENCVLEGFTIQNGRTGIEGGDWDKHTHATIRNNAIIGNTAASGAGVVYCDGPILNNVIRANVADTFEAQGGGLAFCHGTIRHNVIAENQAAYPDGEGGGLYGCDGLVEQNSFYANEAHRNGGGLSHCNGKILSNVIAGNSAGALGGGLFECNGPIYNNTIVSNRGEEDGGGLASCHGTIRNCIIWWNTTRHEFSQLWDSSVPERSCIQDWSGSIKKHNTNELPLFADEDGRDNDSETYDDNDYRLSTSSPCIDAGVNQALNPPGLDVEENLRIAFGRTSLTVDMGAYEFNSSAYAIIQMDSPEGGIRLVWNSQPNNTYVVLACDDLGTGTWTEEASVASEGAFTWWLNPSEEGNQKFYKIEMK